MASSLPYASVTIDESDVPGARLMYDDIAKNTCEGLRRYLACRKIKTTGNKSVLIERVQEAMENKVPVYQQVDSGNWLALKANRERNNLITKFNKPPYFPTAWSPFPTSSSIPKTFCYGHIYAYFTTHRVVKDNENAMEEDTGDEGEKENEDSLTAKPFSRGRQFFKSGHVFNLQDAFDKEHYSLKASVKASFKNIIYSVMVMLNSRGDVVDGTCECKASAMARCSHVAALLFSLEDYQLQTQVACTSSTCSWNQGAKKKDPGEIIKQYNNVRNPAEKMEYHPGNNNSGADDKNRKRDFASAMQQGSATCWGLLLKPEYEDYEAAFDQMTSLKLQVNNLKKTLMFGAIGPVCITSGQGEDPLWLRYRKLLITASTIKEFHLNKTKEQIFNLVERHMYNCKENLQCKNLTYGHKNEPMARLQYKRMNESFIVTETGLWINPKYPGIGASPDGLVLDPNEATPGLLEIKCPILLENSTPFDLSSLTKEQKSRFCCEVNNGHLQLKIQHKYYSQVQTQMAIAGRAWCDFVIWTPKGLSVQRIQFDKNFFDDLYLKASSFHQRILSPEYFEQRVPRKLTPLILNEEN